MKLLKKVWLNIMKATLWATKFESLMVAEGLLNLLANPGLASNVDSTVTGQGKYEIHMHAMTMIL